MNMQNLLEYLPHFFVVFVRIGAFVIFVPFFNNSAFITFIKVGFVVSLTLLLMPALPLASWELPQTTVAFTLVLAGEAMVGLLTGFVFLTALTAMEVLGNMVGFQMAFSMARAVDPSMGEQKNIISVALIFFSVYLFVVLGGDRYLIKVLAESFRILEPGLFVVTDKLVYRMVGLLATSFVVGFRLASPLVLLLLVIDVTLGVIGKTSQKMQIFFVGLPLKVGLGLLGLTLLLDFIRAIWSGETLLVPERAAELIASLRG